ncbi:MAG: ParB N-terminal domain-containing protein, partial [Ignisphaera sp.]|nr:ParB N-terminal domain-containing protein [Ignisphaera sp.]
MEIDVQLLNYLLRRFGTDRLNSSLDPYRDDLKLCVLPIELLRPHEGVIEELVEVVVRDIKSCGYVKYPIVVDVRTMIVLDGHHRYEAFRRLGVEWVPVFLVDYLKNYVDLYPLRKE